MALINPFIFRELPTDAPFCDRQKELADLEGYAEGRANVVIFSPRRFGKTSLVRRVQQKLSEKGYVTLFADFFGVTSLEDVCARLARSVFEVTRREDSLFKKTIRLIQSFRPVLKPDIDGSISLTVEPTSQNKSGLDALEDILSSLKKFEEQVTQKIHFVLDEFQEIVTLKQSKQAEGILRSHIQRHSFSYFFVGSRRRVLLGIFNEEKRPFFQSAINYEIKSLPSDDLVSFLVKMFESGQKKCSEDCSKKIASLVSCHPYYTQKLSFLIYESAGEAIEEPDIQKGYHQLLQSEKPVFEAILQGLAPKQIALLQAISEEPSNSLFSIDYMKRHRLGSSGGIQGALKRLSLLDLIERKESKIWTVVDPIFGRWLSENQNS